MSNLSTPPTSPLPRSPPNPNLATLPPLVTSPPPTKRAQLQRPTSYAKNRLSQYTDASGPSRSRPPSHLFPVFHSSLPYTLVRDFAYVSSQPLHYGPPPEPSQPPSGRTTPGSEPRRLSDPPTSWDSRELSKTGPWSEGLFKGERLEPIHYGDGPPWSEDEDLQSPIVVSSRHKKHKSTSGTFSNNGGQERGRRRKSHGRAGSESELERGHYAPHAGQGDHRYYMEEGGETSGPGGEFLYSGDERRVSQYNRPGQRDSHFAGTLLPNRSYVEKHGEEYRSDSDSGTSSPDRIHDESRYSRDYQFTIASPDEEMHGKAVALFDFERENENELPLVEGQVILVSYRHGQGWLVAEDPKTHESGLVPEEYVRLLRDIKGGLHSLTGQMDGILSPVPDSATPTQAEHEQELGSSLPTSAANGLNGYQQPVVSTFSTSSMDLHPYPQHLLGTQAGMAPPQVVHYHGQRGGSQTNTPTFATTEELLPGAPGVEREEKSPNSSSDVAKDIAKAA